MVVVMADVQATLHEIEVLSGQKAHRKSALVIHNFVTSALRAGDVEGVDAALGGLDPGLLSTFELTSFLIATRPVADRLANRVGVRLAAERALVDEVGEAEALLTLRYL